MQFTTLALGLVAAASTVSAIDLRFHNAGGCGGSYMVCTNWNPNTCCGSANIRYTSISFAAIPTNWRIEVRAHSNGNCNSLSVLQPVQGRNWVCLNEPGGFARLSGAGYGFIGKKRAALPTETCDAQTSTCEGIQAPDTLVLEDGSKFDVTSLDEPQLETLVALATNGSTAEDIPAEFKQFEKTE